MKPMIVILYLGPFQNSFAFCGIILINCERAFIMFGTAHLMSSPGIDVFVIQNPAFAVCQPDPSDGTNCSEQFRFSVSA